MKSANKKLVNYLITLFDGSENESFFTEYAHDLVGFLRDICGATILTEDQLRVCESVERNRVTNVQAAHGLGKARAQKHWYYWLLGVRQERLI